MKIHIIIIFFSVILGASCEKPESQRVNYGSILLESIHFSIGGEIIPLSRAVDVGLQVQIRQNGVLLEGQDYAPGTDFSKRIPLTKQKRVMMSRGIRCIVSKVNPLK